MLLLKLLRLSSTDKHVRRPGNNLTLQQKQEWIKTQCKRLIEDLQVSSTGKLSATAYKTQAVFLKQNNIEKAISDIITLSEKFGYNYED